MRLWKFQVSVKAEKAYHYRSNRELFVIAPTLDIATEMATKHLASREDCREFWIVSATHLAGLPDGPLLIYGVPLPDAGSEP